MRNIHFLTLLVSFFIPVVQAFAADKTIAPITSSDQTTMSCAWSWYVKPIWRFPVNVQSQNNKKEIYCIGSYACQSPKKELFTAIYACPGKCDVSVADPDYPMKEADIKRGCVTTQIVDHSMGEDEIKAAREKKAKKDNLTAEEKQMVKDASACAWLSSPTIVPMAGDLPHLCIGQLNCGGSPTNVFCSTVEGRCPAPSDCLKDEKFNITTEIE